MSCQGLIVLSLFLLMTSQGVSIIMLRYGRLLCLYNTNADQLLKI